MEAPQHELGDGVNCSILGTPGRGHPGEGQGLGGSIEVPGRRREGGIGHFISRAAEPARASVAWSRKATRKGQEPHNLLLPPFARILTPSFPLVVPQLDHSAPWGCSGAGPPLWHSPWEGDRGQPASPGAGGGRQPPAQEGGSWQPGAAPGPSVLFLEGLLRDERPEGVIPEAGTDAEACRQGRERSAHGTAVTGMLPGTAARSTWVPPSQRPARVGAAGTRSTWPGRDIPQLGATVTMADGSAKAKQSLWRGWQGRSARIFGREEDKGRVRKKSRGSRRSWLGHATSPVDDR